MKLKKFAIISVLFVLILGLIFYLRQLRTETPQTKEEAIKQAQAYRPEEACTQALVPAIHKATGAKYTFGSGCLAPGWEAER